MKLRTQFLLFLAFSSVNFAMAQTPVVLPEETETKPEPLVVCESGNLIESETSTVATVCVVTPPTTVVHFFQGFASESSEEALLNHVAKAIAKNPEHACEIVKEAIIISEADAELVAKIVETACLEAPEKMRIIAQCALAANPDALEEIQQVLAKLDPAASDSFLLDGEGTSGKESIETSGKESIEIPPPEPTIEIHMEPPPPPLPPDPPLVDPPPATENDI